MSQPTDTLTEAEERPWEEPGSCRMDCAPPRGCLLTWGGWMSLYCGVATVAAFGLSEFGALPLRLNNLGWHLPVFVPLLGLAVSTATWVTARRDLKKMAAGFMD